MVQELIVKTSSALTANINSARQTPLCVDLDGTLVRTDVLAESALGAIISQPMLLFRLPKWCFAGRAVLKRELGARHLVDASLLPYNQLLLDYLRQQKVEGRKLVLATAADGQIAQAVADHLGIFDEVIASDGVHNLKGVLKADALVQRFGERGFSYAGNGRADVPVWARAAAVVAVDVPPRIVRDVVQHTPIEHRIDSRRSCGMAWLRAIRCYQWSKNALVFVPILTAGKVGDISSWAAATVAFIGFSLTASGIYLINDLVDLKADRRHKRKRHRPLASGDVSLTMAAACAPAMIVSGLACGNAVGVLWLLIVYATVSIAYSLFLKTKPLIDSFLLAGLYTIRIVSGGAATQLLVTPWLLAFSTFFFLDLALIKRVGEIARIEEKRTPGRGYQKGDENLLQQMGVAAAFVSCAVLALYVQSDIASKNFSSPALLWGIVPLLLFWQCRLWLGTVRGYMHDDPIVYAARDWVSWLVGALVLCMFLGAKFLPG